MRFYLETERLILRELRVSDTKGIFELDSDPDVHKFLGNKPIKSMQEAENVVEYIRKQYQENGIARWAVIDKFTEEFIGWSGLKLNKEPVNQHSDFYDIGYRLIKKHWGKGYATESGIAAIQYGFEQLKINSIYGAAHVENTASNKVLKKLGLSYINSFDYEGDPCNWYKL